MFQPGLRCVSTVALEQPAEPFPAHHRSVATRRLDWFYRPTVAQSLVGPFQIEMLNVLFDHVPKVTFSKEDHAIENFSFGILYPYDLRVMSPTTSAFVGSYATAIY